MNFTIDVPKLHAGQQHILDNAKRFNVVRCGRRWGKTRFGQDLAQDPAFHGDPVGWFAPTYKYLMEPWREITRRIKTLISSVNKTEQRVDLITGGSIDFWSLDDPDSGRGRKYKRIIVDEASLVRDLQRVWTESLRPTLSDLGGDGWFLGTPRGRKYFQTLFAKGEQGDKGWASWCMGTADNPYINMGEVDEARAEYEKSGLLHIFEQEYLGIPADDGGNPFGIKAIRECVIDRISESPPVAFGVDLAKSQDWTVVCGLDAEGRVCSLDRFQIDWGQTRQRVLSQVNGWKTLVDSTGVGDPIVEDFQRIRANISGFKFTSTSKQQLMEGLASSIQRNEVRFPEGWLTNEVESFEYEYRPGGHVRYQAPSGLHDDGVCALALAVKCWKEQTKNTVRVRVIGDSGETGRFNNESMWQ